MKTGIFLVSIFFLPFFFSCGQPMAGTECDEYGEVKCGTACESTGQDNVCAQISAALWCDGYTWQVSSRCYDPCGSCVEKGNSAYCECYY